jgi:putative Mg2+ transporter-C (MgtC) family protein
MYDPASFSFQLRILGVVGAAMLLGGLIGLEREMAAKPAGFRTHMLVAGAAALLVSLADLLVTRFGNEFSTGLVRSDPIRILDVPDFSSAVDLISILHDASQ